ncbi:hypothetical protein [Burkholderia cepacia]|uniref:hypothetical protein n=1 Tax=Burkholderia cepacia TaxID=292 RepID=UPI0012D9376C|nr:hypothetical protein [Burkholderia cepacia]
MSEKYNTAQSRKLADGRLEAKLGKVKCADLTTKHFADIIEAILADGKSALAKVVRARHGDLSPRRVARLDGFQPGRRDGRREVQNEA